jgi:hypothetical protein
VSASEAIKKNETRNYTPTPRTGVIHHFYEPKIANCSVVLSQISFKMPLEPIRRISYSDFCADRENLIRGFYPFVIYDTPTLKAVDKWRSFFLTELASKKFSVRRYDTPTSEVVGTADLTFAEYHDWLQQEEDKVSKDPSYFPQSELYLAQFFVPQTLAPNIYSKVKAASQGTKIKADHLNLSDFRSGQNHSCLLVLFERSF